MCSGDFLTQEYIQNSIIVDTQWVADHLDDDNVRLVEVDVDTDQYAEGHIPGAVGWDWTRQLNDQVTRDIVSPEAFGKLLGASGITPETTVVLYGDNNNWFAAYAFWLLSYYGHGDVRLVDGGRTKWKNEDRTLVTEVPEPVPTEYTITTTRPELRATREDIFAALSANDAALVDVRSPDEYTGKVLAPPGLNETAQRGGHIPGAINVPWASAVAEDGTFKPVEKLRALYGDIIEAEAAPIAYCRIGERSSHTWFVLSHLLGRTDARNYDGSWTEYGNLIGAPVNVGPEP